MGEYLDLMAEVDENERNINDDEGIENCDKVSLDSFIDDSIQYNNPSD